MQCKQWRERPSRRLFHYAGLKTLITHWHELGSSLSPRCLFRSHAHTMPFDLGETPPVDVELASSQPHAVQGASQRRQPNNRKSIRCRYFGTRRGMFCSSILSYFFLEGLSCFANTYQPSFSFLSFVFFRNDLNRLVTVFS